MWARATAKGMVSGVVGGCISGMTVWLSIASTYEGGLSLKTFVRNTGEEYPMLAGNIAAIMTGAMASLFVSLFTRGPMTDQEVEAEWEKTRDIDNPLNPWVEVYKEELKLEEGSHFHDRPALDLVIQKFRMAKFTAFTAGVSFTILFVLIWPGSMLTIDVMDLTGFQVWTTSSRTWAFIAATFIILVPLIQEVNAVLKQIKINQSNSDEENSTDYENEIPNIIKNRSENKLLP